MAQHSALSLRAIGCAFLISLPVSSCYIPLRPHQRTTPSPQLVISSDAACHRRAFLLSSVISPLVAAVAPSLAFENRLDDKYIASTPQVGRNPDDLGPAVRSSKTAGSYTGLAPCPSSPNCWCSSTPFGDNPARYLAPWGGKSIREVKEVIDTYEVGQQGIDGGGFQIMKYDEEGQYIYVQFQSYKYGYIDDVELWFNPEKEKFDVRSASRLGMSDLGVNAKRLNYIEGRLEKEFGWELERRKNGSLV